MSRSIIYEYTFFSCEITKGKIEFAYEHITVSAYLYLTFRHTPDTITLGTLSLINNNKSSSYTDSNNVVRDINVHTMRYLHVQS